MEIIYYIGASIIFIWGIAHIVPTSSIVRDFKLQENDKRLILTMEWIAEGLTLCFIGVITFLTAVFESQNTQTSNVIYLSSAVMLFIMAMLSAFTGARTSILPMKICPFVKTLVALMFIIGLLL